MRRVGTGLGTLPAGHITRLVYGADLIPDDDPAENYHEASKISPEFAVRQAPGVAALESNSAMQERIRRAVRRHGHRPTVAPRGRRDLTTALGKAIESRRSVRDFAEGQLALDEVATILDAAYGTRGSSPLRSAPSGGALFPLELYVFALSVDELPAGIFHFNPHDGVLEEIEARDVRQPLGEALIHPELAERASIFVAIAALFWRTRFKYGLRGYRFCLLEAGHVVQNILLAATALELAAVPVGGYFDRCLDRLLHLDGVTESTVYGVAIGRIT